MRKSHLFKFIIYGSCFGFLDDDGWMNACFTSDDGAILLLTVSGHRSYKYFSWSLMVWRNYLTRADRPIEEGCTSWSDTGSILALHGFCRANRWNEFLLNHFDGILSNRTFVVIQSFLLLCPQGWKRSFIKRVKQCLRTIVDWTAKGHISSPIFYSNVAWYLSMTAYLSYSKK